MNIPDNLELAKKETKNYLLLRKPLPKCFFALMSLVWAIFADPY